MTKTVHQGLDLQERAVDKFSAAFEFGSRIDEDRTKWRMYVGVTRRHPDRLSVKMRGSTTLPSSGEIWQCLGDSTDASFIELQRAGGSYPACANTS